MRSKRECPVCGRVLGERARFCVGCGAELPELAEPAGGAAGVEPEVGLPETHPAPALPEPTPPPVDAAPPPAPVDPMVTGAVEGSRPQFDRYAGEAPADGPAQPPAPPPPPAAAVSPPSGNPDVSLLGALGRLARRGPASAGIAGGLVGVAGVGLLGLAVGVLMRAAHGSQGCDTGAVSGSLQGGCLQAGSTNGVLADWNAMLWSIHGVGVSFGDGAGGLVVRIPLGLGMLLCGVILAFAGSVSVRLVPPPGLRDVFVRAGLVALAYTAGMLLLGAVITARGHMLDVGADGGLLFLWGLVIGYLGALAGILRRLFGTAVPRPPVAAARARLGSWAGVVEAGLVAGAAALLLGAVLGAVAAATHLGEAGTVLGTAVADVTTRPLPASPTGTVASVVYLVLGLPTLAAWVLAYSLIIPTVTVGTPLGTADHGLLAGDHDAWLWAVVALPILVTLLAGHVASRRRASGSVESALLDGALGGLAFAAVAFLVVVLLDGGGTLSVAGFAGPLPGGVPGGNFLFGPGMEYTLGALLLWGVVGGAAGGHLSLRLRVGGVRLPFLGRYEPAPPAVAEAPPAVCPRCGLAATRGARHCGGCGAAVGEDPPGG